MLIYHFIIVIIFFLRIWFNIYFLLFLCLLYEFFKVLSKFHFHQHGWLSSVLAMSITNCEKVLMECLTHVRCKNKIVLIFLICIVHTKSFSGWIGKSRDYIAFDYFRSSGTFILFDFKWISSWILNSIIVI